MNHGFIIAKIGEIVDKLDFFRVLWYNGEIGVCMGLVYYYFGGLGMLGTIVCGLAILIAGGAMCIIEARVRKESTSVTDAIDAIGNSVESRCKVAYVMVIAIIVWALSVFCPVRAIPQYAETVRFGDEVELRIEWVEGHGAEMDIGMNERAELHRDVNKYSDLVCKGRRARRNIWYGCFIDERFLALEEIPMPEWLIPERV